MAKKSEKEGVVVRKEKKQETEVYIPIVGRTPLFLNAATPSVASVLIFPEPKKTKAQREKSLKHDPVAEFRRSMYRIEDPQSPTYVGLKAAAFKKAMEGVSALNGFTKVGFQSLSLYSKALYEGDFVPVWGIPQFDIRFVRVGAMKTMDTRCRGLMLEWASLVRIRYVEEAITVQQILNLMFDAGQTQGVGDNRKNGFGRFDLANKDDPEFLRIQAEGGRDAQVKAVLDAEFANRFTKETWEETELRLLSNGRDYTQRGE